MIAPDPKDVQEFQFKESIVRQIVNKFDVVPSISNLIASDSKRGLLYIGHGNLLTIFNPSTESINEWKITLNLPFAIHQIFLNCDYSYLAVVSDKPAAFIYDVGALCKNNLELLCEIRLSTSIAVHVLDLKWNPCIPGMLCAIASDHTIGSFNLKHEKTTIVGITGLAKLDGVDALCTAWSPKGKQIIVGCKNGTIVQLKPDLKLVRIIASPSPSIGEIISLVWISNYQFCAAYWNENEQGINVLIIDAPKGETNTVYTSYEDITFGETEINVSGRSIQYYFDYISEWGVIIAASSNSSEIAVLGTSDNGTTWCHWQLVDSGRAQLPCKDESYPIGITIDRSTTEILPWGPESSLPHAMPVLHVLGTSGKIYSFHIVNLNPNCGTLCSPPSEIISAPQTSQTGLAPLEASFIRNAATSTPCPKQVTNNFERPKAIPATNLFKEMPKLLPSTMEPTINQPKVHESQLVTTAPILDVISQPIKENPIQETNKTQVSTNDIDCLEVYLMEINLFEKELKNRLKPEIWHCGTEEERKHLVEGCAVVDEFLKALSETTSGLSSDIACLKALLLQSFAWVEETKSKNSAKENISNHNHKNNDKIVDLQKRYYYTQSQLTQAIKYLDLEWSEQKSLEQTKMKIPSTECLYQTLIKQNEIITEEKKRLQHLLRKWKSITRQSSIHGLNDSMSKMNLHSQKPTSVPSDSSIIDARCKNIALKTLNFSYEKQRKLKNLLVQSSPKIIKPMNPSPVQDRLEATLSSLASSTPEKVETKSETRDISNKIDINRNKIEKQKPSNPLASLNNIVARIGSVESPTTMNQNKTQTSQTVANTFTSFFSNKPATVDQKLSNINLTMSPSTGKPAVAITSHQGNKPLVLPSLPKPNETTMSFGGSLNKTQPTLQTQPVSLENVLMTDKKLTETSNLLKPGSIFFPTNTSKQSDISTLLPQSTMSNIPFTSNVITSDSPQNKSNLNVTPTKPLTSPLKTPPPSSTMQNLFSTANTVTSQKTTMPGTNTPTQITSPTSLPLLGLFNLSTTLQPSDNVIASSPTNSGFQKSTLVTTPTTTIFNQQSSPQNIMPVVSTNSSSINPTFNLFKASGKTPTTTSDVFSKAANNSNVISFGNSTIQAKTTVPLSDNQNVKTAVTTTVTTSVITGFGQTTASPIFRTPTIPTTSISTNFGQTSITPGLNFGSSQSAVGSNNNIDLNAALATLGPHREAPKSFTIASLAANTGNQEAVNVLNNSVKVAQESINFGSLVLTPTTQTSNASVNSTPTNIFTKAAAGVSSPFGGSSNSPFGGQPAVTSSGTIFGGSSNSNPFSMQPQTTEASSIFGSKPMGTSIFGGATSSIPSANSLSESSSVFDTNAQKPVNSIFGSVTAGKPSIFGNASPAPTSTSASLQNPPATNVFGSAPTIAIGGGSTTGQPAFGGAPTFGSKPAFGSPQPAFSGTKLGFGSGFGSPPAFGVNSVPTGFGSPPMMGTSSPPIGSAVPNVFGSASGSSTFESLAGQSGGLTFGSLAQKTSEPEKPPAFSSGSSFSSWR